MEAGEHDNKYGGTEDQRTDQTSDNEGGKFLQHPRNGNI